MWKQKQVALPSPETGPAASRNTHEDLVANTCVRDCPKERKKKGKFVLVLN
jgi:hypothetical protein